MKSNKSKELEVRLSTAMIYLETNWEGLASQLGVTRQTITAVKSGAKNLGPEPLRKLSEIEKKLSTVSNETTSGNNEPIRKNSDARGMGHAGSACILECFGCKEKDKEILYLRDALKTASNNLAATIELLGQNGP